MSGDPTNSVISDRFGLLLSRCY